MKKILVVPKAIEGMRLDKFLASQLNSFSRTKIHNLINKGAICVDDKIKKPSFHLHKGQRISVIIKKEKNELIPFDFPVKIIHEDEDIIVVDKPQGLVVHPPQKKHYKTLINALIALGKELPKTDTLRPGVVHRLDKETSGVMVLAKNNYSYDNLIAQFKEREVKKEYRALVWGKVGGDELRANLPLSRDTKNRLKMKVSFLKSRPAHTQVEVIKRFVDSTLLGVRPHTGRMHQIRVHLKFLGFPIVGDKKYGIKDKYKELFLHAKELSFRHPKEGRLLKFSSPVPERFKKFIKERELIEE